MSGFYDSKELELVSKRTMAMTGSEGCYWNWGMGVANFGLVKVYRQTKDKKIFDYLKKFVDDNLNGDEIPKTVNTVLPYIVALFLYEETGEEFYAERCREIAEWLMDGAARTKNGGLAHSGPKDGWAAKRISGVVTSIETQNQQMQTWADQLWVDTLYMAVIFLAEAGMKLNNRQYIEEAWKQIKIHAECIQAENGLFYHGYSESLNNNRSAVFWGRGNGWVAACIPEICELTGEADPEAVKIFQKHMEALVRVQDENGLWHTVLDEPASYCETSASSGIVYGMMKGIRLGILPESYIEPAKRGYEAVIGKIAEDGKVTDVSQGTGIRETKESYMEVATIKIMTWGQGLALMMLAELKVW